MVWFQCDVCGDEVKKPKLQSHFRICDASKLSCIDCGNTFGKDNALGHNQCITESEKYGPKGIDKVSIVAIPKPSKNPKQLADIDINVGLSERPPWFCRLCNAKATSKQTLLLHAKGKKHRAKVRAHQAAQQPKVPENPQEDTGPSPQVIATNGHCPVKNTSNGASKDIQNGERESKRRKLEASATENMAEGNVTRDADGIHDELSPAIESSTEKIRWKKLIKSALKAEPNGTLKMRRLKKLIFNSLRDNGIEQDDTRIDNMLEQKIKACSRFQVDGKYVRLKRHS